MTRKPLPPDPKTLARFFASRRRSGQVELATYVLYPFGLASNSVGDITLDHTIALIQSHPEGDICLCPLAGKAQPTESLAWFYADCLAYEHDIPVIVLPTRGDLERFGYRYAVGNSPREEFVVHIGAGRSRQTTRRSILGISTKRAVKDFYIEQLCSILEEVRQLRHGPLTFVFFRHESSGGCRDLPYNLKYGRAGKQVHLYAVALRQADALGEFLSYYRVIESATGDNGKTWVTAAIDRIQSHDFGQIQIAHEFGRRPRNLLAIWRRRALVRISALRSELGSPAKIAEYLYHTDRCGIAHGQVIVRGDIVPRYFEVVRDAYVLKLLARLAIDESC